jgi:hypothetical protein
MSGSHNFQQWNSGAINQDTDAQYTVDAQRVSGAANPSIFPSLTANKLYFQITTFVTAFAQSLANKGYVLSDVNLANLEAVLANVVTVSDLVTALMLYAPILNPTFTGIPRAPTAASGDNSTTIASTAFVKEQGYLNAISGAMVVAALGFAPVQQGGGAGQSGNKIYIGWGTDGHIHAQIDSTDFGGIAFVSDLAAYATLASLAGSAASNGYQRLSSGIIVQWGSILASTSGATTITFPIAFPTGLLNTVASCADGAGPTVANCFGGTTTGFQANAWSQTSTGAPTWQRTARFIEWTCIGY